MVFKGLVHSLALVAIRKWRLFRLLCCGYYYRAVSIPERHLIAVSIKHPSPPSAAS